MRALPKIDTARRIAANLVASTNSAIMPKIRRDSRQEIDCLSGCPVRQGRITFGIFFLFLFSGSVPVLLLWTARPTSIAPSMRCHARFAQPAERAHWRGSRRPEHATPRLESDYKARTSRGGVRRRGKTFRDDWYPDYKANRSTDAGRSGAPDPNRCMPALIRSAGRW